MDDVQGTRVGARAGPLAPRGCAVLKTFLFASVGFLKIFFKSKDVSVVYKTFSVGRQDTAAETLAKVCQKYRLTDPSRYELCEVGCTVRDGAGAGAGVGVLVLGCPSFPTLCAFVWCRSPPQDAGLWRAASSRRWSR